MTLRTLLPKLQTPMLIPQPSVLPVTCIIHHVVGSACTSVDPFCKLLSTNAFTDAFAVSSASCVSGPASACNCLPLLQTRLRKHAAVASRRLQTLRLVLTCAHPHCVKPPFSLESMPQRSPRHIQCVLGLHRYMTSAEACNLTGQMPCFKNNLVRLQISSRVQRRFHVPV